MDEAPQAQDALVDALAQTAFVVTAVLNRVGAEHDLSLTQLRVLGVLRDRRLRMSALAAFLGLEKSTMSGLIDRAATRGLLSRAPDPSDGRASTVGLTPEGLALAADVFEEVRASLRPLIDALTPAHQKSLASLLESMLSTPE